MVKLERLRRFSKGDKRAYAPRSPIRLLFRSRVRLERISRLVKGDNKDYASRSPI